MSEGEMITAGTIEGGLDAIVIGANVEGLVAAGILAREGYTTVLVEGTFEGLANEPKEIAPDFFCTAGDNVVSHFDPEAIDMLDLYRHGLRYVQRRLKSTYHFGDLDPLKNFELLTETVKNRGTLHPDDENQLVEFLKELHSVARILQKFFNGGEVSKENNRSMNWAAVESIESILENRFFDERLTRSLIAEAQFYAASKPGDPQTALSLVHKISGEVSGFKAAKGYIEGGWQGLLSPLRRACQKLGVQFRRAEKLKNVIVEWDRVAGVELMDGGQIRAPAVINTLSAQQAYIDHIGLNRLGIDFTGWITRPRPKVGSLEVAFALRNGDADSNTDFFNSRHIHTLSKQELVLAMRQAHGQEIADRVFLDLVFPNVSSNVNAPSNGRIAQGYLYPVPNSKRVLDENIHALTQAAEQAMKVILPSATIESVDFFAFSNLKAGREPVIREWTRSNALAGTPVLDGYFFAGDEARIGAHPDGSVGRRAAVNAVSFLKTVRH